MYLELCRANRKLKILVLTLSVFSVGSLSGCGQSDSNTPLPGPIGGPAPAAPTPYYGPGPVVPPGPFGGIITGVDPIAGQENTIVSASGEYDGEISFLSYYFPIKPAFPGYHIDPIKANYPIYNVEPGDVVRMYGGYQAGHILLGAGYSLTCTGGKSDEKISISVDGVRVGYVSKSSRTLNIQRTGLLTIQPTSGFVCTELHDFELVLDRP